MPVVSKRQRFPRYPIQLPLLHKAESPAPASDGVGWTHDLSEVGMCAELAQRLPPQTSLTVRLRTDMGAIELGARTVWAGDPPLSAGGVRHGQTYTKVTPEQEQAVKDLVFRKGELLPVLVRVPLELPVLCRPKGGAAAPLEGHTGDISRGGILLRLPRAISPDTALELVLRTPTGPLTTEGAAVWVDPPEKRTPGEPVRHGVRFTDLDWATSMSLGRVLAETA
jgi:hypothetical protein